MQRLLLIARRVRVRRGALATTIETSGFALIVVGVGRLASLPVALIVAGVLVVLKAYEVDR